MKKKDSANKVKLQLNRETLRGLEQQDLTGIHGGASLTVCSRPCATRFNSCPAECG